ncbi:MAG TPA: 30S ribosomal protein S11 [Candidatus Saccharimonadales bacterium]|jgi:small subunit ribosomal protein S11|nr:30S ribosomal protein S11 [Candidatus Saccharimonadales bacterium]
MADKDIDTTDIKEEAPVVEVAEGAPAPKPKKKKVKRTVPTGQLHILATFNNTIVSFTDHKGGILVCSSAGACGFRGSKKGTAYAAQVATEKAGQEARQTFGLSKVDIYVKGIGLGRDSAIRSLQNLNIEVDSIKDVTGVPHGGVRPRKARRV